MDQVMTFLGRHKELTLAVDEAQHAANNWLEQNSMSVGTIYNGSSQTLWHEPNHSWYHIITLTLDFRVAAPSSTGDAADASK